MTISGVSEPLYGRFCRFRTVLRQKLTFENFDWQGNAFQNHYSRTIFIFKLKLIQNSWLFEDVYAFLNEIMILKRYILPLEILNR